MFSCQWLEQKEEVMPTFEEILELIRTNKTEIYLSFKDRAIGDEGATALVKALETNTTLKHLSFWCCPIGDKGAQALATALQTNTTLKNLLFYCCPIGDKGSQALATALQTNTTLKELSLWSSTIGDKGSQALATALQTNTTLKELLISSISIGDEGVQTLATALKTNKTLRSFWIGNNVLGVSGAQALATALQTNTTLQGLFLLKNSIGYEVVQTLATALKTNKTLQIFGLSWNNIGVAGATALATALETNTTLQMLFLPKNHDIPDDIRDKITDLLKRNKVLAANISLHVPSPIPALSPESVAVENSTLTLPQEELSPPPDADTASLYSTHTQTSVETHVSVASISNIVFDETDTQHTTELQERLGHYEQQLSTIHTILEELRGTWPQQNISEEAIEHAITRINSEAKAQGKKVIKSLKEIKTLTTTHATDVTARLNTLTKQFQDTSEEIKKGNSLIEEVHQWKKEAIKLKAQKDKGFSELSYKEVFIRAIKVQLTSKAKQFEQLITGVIQAETPSLFPNATSQEIWNQIDTNAMGNVWDRIAQAMPLGVGVAFTAIKAVGIAWWQDHQREQAQNVVEMIAHIGEGYLLEMAEEVATEFDYLFKEGSVYPKLQLWELGTYVGGRILSCLMKGKVDLERKDKTFSQQVSDYVYSHPASTVRTPSVLGMRKHSIKTDIRIQVIDAGHETTPSQHLTGRLGLRRAGDFAQEGIVHHRAVMIVPPGKDLILNNATHILVVKDRKKDIDNKQLKYGYRMVHERVEVNSATSEVVLPTWYKGLYAYEMTNDIRTMLAEESVLVKASHPVVPQTSAAVANSIAAPAPQKSVWQKMWKK